MLLDYSEWTLRLIIDEKTLIVFHRGKLVGSILDKASTGISFQYSDDADFRLSASLPFSNKIYTAKEIEPFFSGLLPDGELREQIAKDAHVSSSSWFKLLSNYGREIAGAIEIIEDDEESSDPTKYSYTKLQKEEISTRISNANAIPLLTWGGKTRMSLAGAQNKIALFEKEGELYMPNGGAPTNVILKAGVNSYSINEYATTHIASYLGINTPETLIKDYDGTLAFITRRFDRKEVDVEVSRRYVSGTICRSRKQIRRRWWSQYHQNKRLVNKSNGDTNHILQGIR